LPVQGRIAYQLLGECAQDVHGILQCGSDLAPRPADKNFYCEFVANLCYVSATRLPRLWQVCNLLSNPTPLCLLFQQLNRKPSLIGRASAFRPRPSAAETGRAGGSRSAGDRWHGF
jgi:hypothetical protein